MIREYDNAYITRIGFFDHWNYEVFVVTDDVIQVPHFHVRNDRSDIAIELNTNIYLPHCKGKSNRLPKEVREGLADFMAQPCRSPHFANYYEYAAFTWNMQNHVAFRCNMDKSMNILIPNYVDLHVNIDREKYANEHGEYEGYDNAYVDYLKHLMIKRTWI